MAFPRDWVRNANRLDEIWTPTEFNRQAMLTSGIRRPIHVIPLGVDRQHFHPGIRRVRPDDESFVFLANFEWGERKCPS